MMRVKDMGEEPQNENRNVPLLDSLSEDRFSSWDPFHVIPLFKTIYNQVDTIESYSQSIQMSKKTEDEEIDQERVPFFKDLQKTTYMVSVPKIDRRKEIEKTRRIERGYLSRGRIRPEGLDPSSCSTQDVAISGDRSMSRIHRGRHLKIKEDFPIFNQNINGKPLVWLDSAATTQKPQVVLDHLLDFYQHHYSNVHRGAHTLALRATEHYERARATIKGFLNAASQKEIVFTRGTTEGINLVAYTLGKKIVRPGDSILISMLEHHSNMIPWQILAKENGAHLVPIPIDESGDIVMGEYEKYLNTRVKIVALTHVSNVLGTVLPIKEMTQMAHYYGALVLIDGAQGVAHVPVDVQEIDCDFYTFSGHKIYAPTGIGALYGKRELLEEMPVWQSGGSMVESVSLEEIIYQDIPHRFEAGTGNIAAAVGFSAALDYFNGLGRETIYNQEQHLLEYALSSLSKIKGVRIVGRPKDRSGLLSFLMDNHRPIDVVKFLDEEGIALRSGFHCAEPGLRRLGLDEGTVRASFGVYNDEGDVDHLCNALRYYRDESLLDRSSMDSFNNHSDLV